MSWIDRGKSKTHFDRYKTYEHERVQKRLESILPAVDSKVEQALAVNSALVIIYKQTKFGLPCSCNIKEHHEQDFELDSAADTQENPNGISYRGSNLGGMFGMGSNTISLDDVEAGTANAMDHADILSGADGNDEYVLGNEDGQNVNCGICFRTGVQPGFSATGFQYAVLTHHHVRELSEASLDQTTNPSSFVMHSERSYVDFKFLIPKFFKSAKYGVRDNTELLPAWPRPKIVTDSGQLDLTKSNLDQFRGKEVTIRITGHERFTHLSIFFDQGLPPINGNLSEEQNILNYDEELTVGSLTVVLPHRVGKINPGDILSIPFKKYVLRVSDAPKKRTAKNHQWEWVCQCRAIQKREPIYQIDKGYDIK